MYNELYNQIAALSNDWQEVKLEVRASVNHQPLYIWHVCASNGVIQADCYYGDAKGIYQVEPQDSLILNALHAHFNPFVLVAPTEFNNTAIVEAVCL